MLAFGATPAQAAGPSLICPPNQSFTVASGASYIIDLSSCNTFGLNDNAATALHGTITGLTNNQDNKATYTNNGDGALSDTFVLLDESQGEITFTVTVLPAAAAFTVAPGSLTAPVIGVPYSQGMSASGGVAPYTYAFDSGTLPPGITVSSSGVISGTVTATGSFAFGVKVTDSTAGTPQVVIKNYSVTVAIPTLSITPTTLAAGGLSAPYSQQMSTLNGTAPFTYVVESGSLPPGLSLSSSGLLSGTPSALGTYNFVIKSTDVTGGNGPYNTSRSYSLVINAQPPPTITGVSPASGPATGGTAVTITGTGFTGVTALKFGANNGVSVTVVNATTITATSPSGSAGTVNVTVTATGGTSATGAANQFTYIPAPTVTSISPTAGPASGGTSVTITGTGFTGATAVTFGATAATGFTVNSATQITATAPAGTGTVDVRVTTTGGTSATSGADQYTFVAVPTVTSISPTAGPATGGTTVTITGTGFGSTTAVTFGATAATGYTVNSATQITATAPAGSAGTVDVRVTTAGGTSATSAADQFTYVARPVVSSISPTSGPTTGGATVIITGSNFSGTTAVTFGATAATGYTVNSATQITATAPAGSAGTVDVRVTSVGGTSNTSANDQFTYVTLPAVSSISPTAGPATGGTSVVITGTGFSGTTAVTFGATAASGFTVNSTTQITATAPSGTGTVDVRVTTPGGTSAAGAADKFTYVVAPTVTGLSPTQGPTSGGTTVTITGTGFGGTTAVTFGSIAATGFTVNSATQITATAPAGSGTVDVRITTAGGTSVAVTVDQFTYVGVPVVSGLSPTAGPTTGGTSVTINGAGFTGATAVTFGSTAATGFTVSSATQISATAPAGTGTVDVTVTTPGGTSAAGAADKFTYVLAPTVTGLSPTQGPTSGGTTVTIIGTGFGGTTAVTFGSTAATGFTVNSATQITATAPAGSGTVDVRITTAGGTSVAVAADQFTYVGAPVVSGLSPTAGPTAGGTSVTINGTGFTGATAVTFGSTAATGFTVNSATQITATAPSGSGTVDVRVTTTGGTSATGAADQFTYVAVPVVTGIAPASGAITGGTSVVVTGTGFGGASAVRFGGANATSFTVNSATQITAISPSGSLGVVDVKVTTVGGTSANNAADQFTYIPTGVITFVTPTATSVPLGNSLTNVATSSLAGGSYGAISYTSSNMGVATVSSSGVITPVAAGTSSITATQAAVAGVNAQAAQSYTLTVTSAMDITPASLPGANVGTAYSQQLTASGGIGPYAFAVTGSVPTGMTLSAVGVLSGTPTAAGSFALSVKVTDTRQFTATKNYTLAVASATLALTPATLSNPTAEAAYSATLSATGGTAPYTFSVSSGTLPAGLSLNGATGVLSGTTNVAGSFPFSIKVTDSSTGVGAPFSASNSYTLAVAAPVLTLTPASLAAIRAGDAYSQTFTAAGGIAPYAYSVSSGTLPTGLVLNAATGIVSGTPTVAGSYNFTLQAKDAHQFTVQQALTLQVNQAPPPVPNETATTSANQEVSLTIASTDGSPITDVTIVTPPQHGRVTVVTSGAAGGGSGRSFKVTYVPNANYFGPDAFSYTATGPGGTSAPATVSVTVAPQPVPVPVAKTVTVLAGTPVTLPVTQGATGGPFTAVAITTQPASGTAVVNGMDIVYTPGINTSGQISIGYTVSNVFGTSAPVTSTISVNPMPQVASQSATVVAGLTVNVDLTAGATGGPFTAANVLSVAPAEAGKAVVRDVGTAGKPSYQLSFAASGKFAGAAVVSYTLSNAFATSKPGVVNVTVTARRDPSVDPEVIGLQAAQADAARRFASAQLSNFTQRLESLHGDGWGRSSFGLSLTPPNDSGNPTAALARWQADEADRVFGTAVKPFMRKASLRQPDAGFSSERQQVDVSGATNGLPEMPQRPDTQKQALALWLGGAVDFGQHYVNGRDTGFRFRTNGVSVGGDYRISDLATLGVGAGFSHDRSDVGQNGSRSTADSAVAAVYGSLRPSKGVFLDGVLGYGTLQYDASRYLTDGSGFATGERDGKQVFGALVGGIEMRQETWMWSPYGRVELMSAKLDPYTEKAAGINALSYFKQTVRSRIGALGVRAEGIYVGGLGTWFPRARLEYRHQFQGADDARLAYADLAADGPVYVIRTVPQQTGNWTAGLGVKLLLSNGMTITLDYNSNLNMDSGRSQSVMFGIAMPLK
nr:IPT/TIG domain-containing protein [Janthinobacterium lividum]